MFFAGVWSSPPPTIFPENTRSTTIIPQDLFQLAEDMGMTDKMRSIALGQGQGAIAAAMIEKVKPRWVEDRRSIPLSGKRSNKDKVAWRAVPHAHAVCDCARPPTNNRRVRLTTPGSFGWQLGAASELPSFHLVDVGAGEVVRGNQSDADSSGLPTMANLHAKQILPDGHFTGDSRHNGIART